LSTEPLAILGIGIDLPPAVSVLDFVTAKGADTSRYHGWRNVCHARGDDDHPSTMASRALQVALTRSGVSPTDLRLVLFTGASRDYLPSWSVSTEVMRLNGVGTDCLGLDVTVGCLAALSALDLAHGWLALRGGGYAAVLAAERWSHTIDHTDPKIGAMWAYGDAGAAFVVGVNTGRKPVAEFLGAEFVGRPDFNGHVMVPYGGTREPVAPPGVSPYMRRVSDRSRRDLKQTYVDNYGKAADRVSTRFRIQGERLICNQMSNVLVEMIAEALHFPLEQVVVTGHDTGHLGACDIMVGLDLLTRDGPLDKPTLMGGSTAYAFGVGLVVPPGMRA
jgi:3-oxoacyl-[acyl-carrier-protein] synthase III